MAKKSSSQKPKQPISRPKTENIKTGHSKLTTETNTDSFKAQPIVSDKGGPRPVLVSPVESVKPLRGFKPILLDWRLRWLLIGSACLFVLLVAFKINVSSSVPMWNRITGMADNKSDLVAGTPKWLRSDEWDVYTPFTLSQYNRNFPVENPALGVGKVPLLTSMPTWHFITLFKPNLWGYFFLDVERGFAWNWAFKLISVFLVSTLLLLLLTQNNFWLSVFGAFWITYSSPTQWYFTAIGNALPDTIMSGFAIILAIVYLIYAKKIVSIWLCALLATFSAVFYISIFYPPHQIVIAYCCLFLVIGYLVTNWNHEQVFEHKFVKFAALGTFLMVTAGISYAYYIEIKSTVEIVTNTVYPGRRTMLGGSGFVSNLYAEYVCHYLDEFNVPKNWVNICEQSGFIVFFPFVALVMGITFFQTKRFDPVMVSLLAYILFIFVWVTIEFSPWLAKVTLLTYSPPYRSKVGMGVADVLLAIVYLNSLQKADIKYTSAQTLLLVLAAISLAILGGQLNIATSDSFFSQSKLIPVIIFFAIAHLLLVPAFNFRYRVVVFTLLLIGFLSSNLTINPISVGLKPIIGSDIYKIVREQEQKDPGQGWIVMGQFKLSQLVMATGINVLTGVKYTPDIARTRKAFDVGGREEKVYNRYAHIELQPFVIPNKDTVMFRLNGNDYYTLGIDPSSNRLKKFGAKYILFGYEPNLIEIRNLERVTPTAFLYKLKS